MLIVHSMGCTRARQGWMIQRGGDNGLRETHAQECSMEVLLVCPCELCRNIIARTICDGSIRVLKFLYSGESLLSPLAVILCIFQSLLPFAGWMCLGSMRRGPQSSCNMQMALDLERAELLQETNANAHLEAALGSPNSILSPILGAILSHNRA